jgi:hypothetical protein
MAPLYSLHAVSRSTTSTRCISIEVFYADRSMETFGRGGVGSFDGLVGTGFAQ